jgi:hypothetical protein
MTSLIDYIEPITFLVKEENPQLKLCVQCQRNEHYCNAIVCRTDLAGCLATYWPRNSQFPDGKTLKTFLPFTWEEVFRDQQYSGDECLQNSREHCGPHIPILSNAAIATCNKCTHKCCDKEHNNPKALGCYRHNVDGSWILTFITKEHFLCRDTP